MPSQSNNRRKLEFLYIDTECGWDFIQVFDGSSTDSPEIARLCGNRNPKYGYNDVITSTSTSLVITFNSDSEYTATGFAAMFTVLPASKVCKENSECLNGGNCSSVVTDFSPYTGREYHSTAYDPQSDVLFLTGGKTSKESTNPYIDLFIYDYDASKWLQPSVSGWKRGPTPRYNHVSWVTNGKLYLIGGQTFTTAANYVWVYDPISNSWGQQYTLGMIPALGEGVSYVVAKGRTFTRIYALGGYVPYSFSYSISRSMFMLDLGSMTWTRVADCPVPGWGMSGVYHLATNSLYFIGGYRWTTQTSTPTLKYEIDSNFWYNGPPQDPTKSMTFSTVALLPSPNLTSPDSDLLVAFGGYQSNSYIMNQADNPCLSDEIQVLDLACGTWSYFNVSTLNGAARSDRFLRRKGHSMIVRNGSLVVTGGNSGYLLQDLVTLDVPIGVDGGKDGAVLRDQCKATQIDISNKVFGTIPGQSSSDYVVVIDLPDYDLAFSLTQLNNTDARLSLTILSIQPRGSVYTNASGTISLLSRDSRRYSGPYYLRIRNPSEKSLSYSLTVTPTQNLNYPDFSPMRADSLDITTFITIFILSLFVSLSLTYLIKRARDQILLQRQIRNGEAAVVPKEPPNLFRILLDLPGSVLGNAGVGSVSIEKSVSLDGQKGGGEKGIERKAPILKSRFIGNDTSSDLKKKHQPTLPLSAEIIPGTPNTNEKVLAINYLIVFPDCERTLKSGSLPTMAVATQLMDCTAERIPTPPPKPEESSWWTRTKKRFQRD
ncbi:Multiple epidermal growth factor-like domains protein 8 [Phlyctochytrium planicorne]|nr:Multiple epidermal growth factor-like domains protein 8 [Phlyctochytrium planicorne]